MTKVPVYNLQGKEVEQIELNPAIFDVAPNTNLVAQVVRVQEANAREPIAHTKTRTNVRGGGRKPWKQKGTGRARVGSIRSPLWRGGGIVFGPLSVRNFSLNINKKQKQKALFMALTDKVRDNKLVIVDSLTMEAPKTQQLVAALSALKVDGSALVTTATANKPVALSARNIQKVQQTVANSLNVRDVLKHQYLVVEKSALEVLEATYNKA